MFIIAFWGAASWARRCSRCCRAPLPVGELLRGHGGVQGAALRPHLAAPAGDRREQCEPAAGDGGVRRAALLTPLDHLLHHQHRPG
eukprot:6103328-Pyramimonas_sp.AAC.1